MSKNLRKTLVYFLPLFVPFYVYGSDFVTLTPVSFETSFLTSKAGGEFTTLPPIVIKENDHTQISPDLSEITVLLPEGFEFDTTTKINISVVNTKLDDSDGCAGPGNKAIKLGTSSAGATSINIQPESRQFTFAIKQASAGNCKGTLTISGGKIRLKSGSLTGGKIVFDGSADIAGLQKRETSLGDLEVVDDIERDTTPPVIEIFGSNPLDLEVFSDFIDPGARAVDAVDGEVLVSIENEVNITLLGEYVVRYRATDQASNTTTVSRTVNILDTTSPIITLKGDDEIFIKLNDSFTDPGVEVSDNYDETLEVITSGFVDVGKVGVYTLLYRVTDSSGNVSEVSRTVNVVDKIPPTLNVVGTGEETIEAGSVYNDRGANALYESRDVSSNIVITGLGFDTKKIGTYTISYSLSIDGFNVSKTRIVHVVDTLPPKLELKGNSEINLFIDEMFVDPGVQATDLIDGDLTTAVEKTALPGILTEGTFLIEYKVSDLSGNVSKINRVLLITKRPVSNDSPTSNSSSSRSNQGSRRIEKLDVLSSPPVMPLPQTPTVLGASTIDVCEVSDFSRITSGEISEIKKIINEKLLLNLDTQIPIDSLMVEALDMFQNIFCN